MNMAKKRIQYLYGRYARGLASDYELRELQTLLADPRHEGDIISWLDEVWDGLDRSSLADLPEKRREAIFQHIVKERKQRFGFRAVGMWSAAAVVLIALAFFSRDWALSNRVAETISLTQSDAPDIDPGTDRAILTLDDGTQVILDGQEAGQILSEPSLQINKEAGDVLVYLPSGNLDPMQGATLKYNTLSTPAGGQYRVMLPDGTQVVLNASSRLRYPQRFPVGERIVEFEGEGYFEVKSDPSRPFVVKTDAAGLQQEVRVLGTEFNINSYDYEGAVVTTVVGGQVAVSGRDAAREVLLGAGRQAVLQGVSGGQPSLQSRDADINEALAWKDGLFLFNSEPLPSLLKRVARWYDVTFVYEGNVDDVLFQGNYFRGKGLLNLLANLEAAGRVQFRIDQTYTDERRIYVMEK